MKYILLVVAVLFLILQVTSGLDARYPLRMEVFDSLKQTPLKNLSGVYREKNSNQKRPFFMNYKLIGNKIDEVSADSGFFEIVKDDTTGGTIMLTQLTKTQGTFSGTFEAKGHAFFQLPKKPNLFRTLIVPLEGNYTAKVSDMFLEIRLNVPAPLSVHNCSAQIEGEQIELQITEGEESTPGFSQNLNPFLRQVLSSAFSNLFCDTMERLLVSEQVQPIVEALTKRYQQLMGDNNSDGEA